METLVSKAIIPKINCKLNINKTDTIIKLDRLITLLKYKKAKNENV